MQQQNLKILFSRAFTPYSAVIRAYPPNGPFSHCGILKDDKVIEALAFSFKDKRIRSGVMETSIRDFLDRNTRVVLVEMQCPNVMSADKWLKNTLGQKYDWLYVAAIPFRARNSEQPNKWACSEHVKHYVMNAELDIFDKGMHGLTPNHLYQLLYAAGARITKEYK